MTTIVLPMLAAIALVLDAPAAVAPPAAPGVPSPSPAALAEAKALFTQGNEHFTRGTRYLEAPEGERASVEFERAVELFQAAYELSRLPDLLFNIGQAERHRGRCAQALAAYRSFVALIASDHPYRLEAVDRIAQMEECLAQPASLDSPGRSAPTPPLRPSEDATRETVPRAREDPSPAGSWRRGTVIGLALIGGMVASGVAGGVYAWRARDLEQKLEARQTAGGLRWDETAVWLQGRGQSAARSAFWLGAASLALGAAGAAVLVLESRAGRDDRRRVSLNATLDGGLIAGVSGAF